MPRMHRSWHAGKCGGAIMLDATRTTAPSSADRIVAMVMEWIGHGAELKRIRSAIIGSSKKTKLEAMSSGSLE